VPILFFISWFSCVGMLTFFSCFMKIDVISVSKISVFWEAISTAFERIMSNHHHENQVFLIPHSFYSCLILRFNSFYFIWKPKLNSFSHALNLKLYCLLSPTSSIGYWPSPYPLQTKLIKEGSITISLLSNQSNQSILLDNLKGFIIFVCLSL